MYPDLEKGSPLIVKALYDLAVTGNKRAQLVLSEMYLEGECVEYSMELSKAWSIIAMEDDEVCRWIPR